MNYKPVITGNQTNRNACIKDNVDAVHTQQYIMLPLLYDNPQSLEDAVTDDAGKKGDNEKPANEGEKNMKVLCYLASNRALRISPSVSAAGQIFDNVDDLPTDPLIPDLEDTADLLNTGIFSGAYDDEDEGKHAIGTKWVYRNKKDERGIVVRNKARLVAQDYTQEEGIDYDEVFALVARIEAIGLFLAYASFIGFIVYQMDVKSAFLYGTIKVEVYVCQPPSFEDPQFPDKVYKVEKALYGLHQAPRAWYKTLSTYLLENGFRRGTIDKTLFIKKDKGDILLVEVYVDDIIFGSTKKSLCIESEQMMHKRFQMSSMGELTFLLGLQTASTLIETNKALLKDEEVEDVDVNLYRSMIGSLMYLIASRLDIMFVVYAYARFQVTPKVSYLHAVKRIFRYLKGQRKLGLWYPRDSPFDFEAFLDSDYAGASLDRNSTTGGYQFLGKRLISWQCKKKTIVTNSTTEAEYVAATNYYGQVLWIQNQMLDYWFNFMNTKIHIDNESTISIVKNPVLHAKTKHIEIRHHYIRDSYKKRLIQVIKMHTDHNVADLLTKAFDVSSISNEFRVKTGGCKVNAARQDLVLLGENLKFVDQHNMVVCLEKSKGNADFHEIVDFLTASSVHYALTISPTIYASYIKQFCNTLHSQTVNDVKQSHATVDGNTVVISESSVMSDLHFNDEDGITCLTNDAIFENLALMGVPIPNVADESVFQEWDDRVVRATTTATSLDAAQDSGNISKTQSTTMSNDPLSQEIGLGNTPGSDEKRIKQDDLTNFIPPTPHDSPLSGGHTPGSDEVIRMLKKKVKKLEKKLMARTPRMKLFKIGTSKRKSLDEEYVSKQGRKSDKTKTMFDDSDFAKLDVDNATENVEGDAKTQGRNTAEQTTTTGDTVNIVSIDVSAAGPLNVSTADPSTSTVGDIFKDEMMTIADTLVAIRSTRPRTTSAIIHDIEEEPRRSTSAPTAQPSSKDKGKALMVEPKKPSKNPRKAQIQMDEELAIRLHKEEKAELERMQRERAAQEEASNAALIIEFDNVQA
ncbi:putative ribonuclease H-like domain-containing protein [Tanacetum coccineum]